MCWKYKFNDVMKELRDRCAHQMFVRMDNKHLFIQLTIELPPSTSSSPSRGAEPADTPKKIFTIDTGNLLRETYNKR